MPQSSTELSSTTIQRRASSRTVQERRIVSALLKPYVLRFDQWHREAAYLRAALVRADQPAENERLRSRFDAIAREVDESFESCRAATANHAHTSMVRDLTLSYRNLLTMLRTHGAA